MVFGIEEVKKEIKVLQQQKKVMEANNEDTLLIRSRIEELLDFLVYLEMNPETSDIIQTNGPRI